MEEKQKTEKTSLSRPLFLCDVDGTLINNSLVIAEKDIQAIRRWKAKGYDFGLVTGRARNFCLELMKQTEVVADCLITSNGAVTDWKGEEIDTSLIEIERVKEIFQELRPYIGQCYPFMTIENGTHYFPLSDMSDQQFAWIQEVQAALRWFAKEDLYDYLSTCTKGSPKLSIYTGSEEKTQHFLPIFRDLFPDTEVMRTSFDYIEITQKGTDKATALSHLMKKTGIPARNISYVGDADNDLGIFHMLEETYVMDTAPETVKQAANVTVHSAGQAMEERLNALCQEEEIEM